MINSIFHKEWLKTRRIFIVLLVIMLAAAIYTVMKIHAAVESHGIVQFWLAFLQKDVSYLNLLLWLPVVCGIAVGVAQYVPEVSHFRLKLTLHLPINRGRLISLMLSVGIVELIIMYALQTTVIAGYYSRVVHSSMMQSVVVTLLPRYLAGLAAYLLVASIILEGKWSRRLLLTFLSIVVIMIYSQNLQAMSAYTAGMMILLILFLPLALCLVFGSIIRFKEGLRD